MFHQLYILHKMDNLPPSHRTAEARKYIEIGYDHCGVTLLMPWLFGLDEGAEAMAAN